MPLFLSAAQGSQGAQTQLTSNWHPLTLPTSVGPIARLSLLGDGAPVANLENVGSTPIHVEVQDEQGEFHLTAFLEPSESCPVGANTRFYVSGHQGSTMHYLSDRAPQPANESDAAAEAAGNPGKRALPGSPSSASNKRQRALGNLTALYHSSPAAAEAAAAAAQAVDPLDGVPDAPMHLLGVRSGIPSWAGQGFLGVRVCDLVRGDMRWVLCSNYMVDLAWLLSACPDLRRVPRLVVVHGEHAGGSAARKLAEDVREAGIQDRTTLFAPPLPIQYGTHHSKAFLIEYERGLRVIIFTANAIYPDCSNKSQGLFWQDFPPKDAQSPPTSQFQQDLATYLAELRLPPTISRHCRDLMERHDFSAARAHLVSSVPGYHKEVHKWGHMRLRALLNREPPFPSAFKHAPLVAQYSSVGSVDEAWLTGEFRASLAAGRCGNGSELLGLPPQGPAGLRLVWPTVEEVQNCIEGWGAGGSIPGPSRNVERPYLMPYYSRWGGEVCGRQRAMPHIKSYLRHKGQEVAWMYVGSHNLSKAAWGALQKQGSQLMVRSYELGVLLVPSREAAYRASRWRGFSCTSSQPWQQQQQQAVGSDAGVEGQASSSTAAAAGGAPAASAGPSVRFLQWQRSSSQDAEPASGGQDLRVPLPIPYRLPPERYGQQDQPWTADKHYPGLDSMGCNIEAPYKRLYGLLDSMEWGD